MAFYEHEHLGGHVALSPADIERSKSNHQWSATSAISANPDKNKVWFLRQAIGTNMTLTIEGKTIFSGVDSVDFHDDGIRLGDKDWSLSGVAFAMGYNVQYK